MKNKKVLNILKINHKGFFIMGYLLVAHFSSVRISVIHLFVNIKGDGTSYDGEIETRGVMACFDYCSMKI